MTPLELLRFFAPGLANIDDATVQKALDLAADYRPSCLPVAKQDEAQAWYAAWILTPHQEASERQATGITPPTGVKREREGDLEREYFAPTEAGSIRDPFGYHGQYLRLAKLCRGSITVGHAHVGFYP